jgi:hypothetical protein
MFYYPPVTNPAGGLAILRSTDNGLTWSLMKEINLTSYYNVVASSDILACGDSVSNLKVCNYSPPVFINSGVINNIRVVFLIFPQISLISTVLC